MTVGITSRQFMVGNVCYEPQWIHDAHIEDEARKLKRNKILSRRHTGSPEIRKHVLQRAKGGCEICRFPLPEILNLHHIYPVRLGGAASHRNLIAICPQCHASVHWLSRARFPDRKIERLVAAGYTDTQAVLIRLISSHDAHVLEDGTIEPYTDPEPVQCVIIDAPDADPAMVDQYWNVIEARQRRAQRKSYSHIERGRQICQQP